MIPIYLSPQRSRGSAAWTAALTSALLLAGVFAASRPAIGQLVPPPPDGRRPIPPIRPIPAPGNAVTVKSVAVNATIRDGVAETDVSHVLANRTGAPQEADLLFPIPNGASISSFALYDGEKRMDARLLDRDEACRTYEEIVRRRRDPALLTFEGRSALRARVFPVEPNSERRITLKLVTVLPREGDAKKYAWTLVGPHLPGASMPESVSVHVTLTGSQPIGNVYSPTQAIRVRRDSDTRVVVNWDSDKDRTALAENPEFTLYTTPGHGRSVALSVLTYNAALPQVASLGGGARQSGYFLVVASPTIANAEKNALPRHVVMVLDRSGSMQGKKIEQAKGALRFALGKLRPADSFNIMTFSDQVERFSPEQVGATADNIKRANAFVDDIVADGGTNINDALKAGLSQFGEKGSGNTLLFFTDGLPTVGVKSQDQIVQNAVTENGRKARTFVFGVGYDVDVPFLDNVARTLRGDADYVRPDEDIEVKTSQFVAKTSAPVLENLKVSVDGIRTGEIYPRPDSLPDLFAGSQLVLVGRYTGGNEKVHLTLTGDANGKPQRYDVNAAFPAVDTDSDFLPRLWASRKIGYLMDEVRLAKDEEAKKETIDQIIALSKEFGILTPYTALFVPEPTDGYRTPRPVELQLREYSLNRGAGGFGGGRVAATTATPALDAATGARGARQGEAAVNSSQASRAQRYQEIVGNSAAVRAKAGMEQKKDEELARRIQSVGSRAFYQVGSLWQDATYDAKKQKQIVKIKLYSPAYFALTRRNTAFAQWAALGENVLVAANATQAVQFGPEGKDNLTEAEVKELAGR